MRRVCGSTTRGAIGLMAMAAGMAVALAQPVDPPLPPPRPDRPAPAEPAPATATAVQDQAPPSAPGGTTQGEAANGASAQACADSLARLGVRFETRPPVRDNACSVQDPVLLSGLPDGLEVAPPALMTCPLAEALARWTLELVSAEADRHFQAAPTKILIGTSYECRNQRSGSKLSEHAFGNGVDVMGFAFEKRGAATVGASPEGSPETSFLSAIQKGACPFFSTVLGPGSDAAHGNHLHLDMRGRKGGYRICQ